MWGVGTLDRGVGTLDRGGGVGTLDGGVGTLDGGDVGTLGSPPPPPMWTDRRMDGWTDTQTRVKTLPSPRTTYAVGKNKSYSYDTNWDVKLEHTAAHLKSS